MCMLNSRCPEKTGEKHKIYSIVFIALSCKKHVEDDVTRKLDDLRVGALDKKEFLLDIFGSDARKEMGLIDASSSQEFDAHLESLYPVWVKREMEARGLSKEATTEFYPYFLTNVATDMKTTMIKSVREKVGLGENFFYAMVRNP